MIKINETYSIKSYQFGWELHTSTKTESPKAKKEFTVNVTYYPNLTLICSAVIDKSAKGCDSIEKIVNAVERATAELKEMIAIAGKI